MDRLELTPNRAAFETKAALAIERRKDGQWQIVKEVWTVGKRGEEDWRSDPLTDPFLSVDEARLRLAEIRTAMRS